jgi:hypothetical protein
LIIHQAEIETKGDAIVVSARVEIKTSTSIPKYLWYKFPAESESAISLRGEAFFNNLFVLGMHFNEEIELRGDISPVFVENIKKLSSIYYRNDEKKLNIVDYKFKSVVSPDVTLKRDIHLASFSGGADSFYTFWSHFYKEKASHPTNLTHGLFIHGYDISLNNEETYNHYLSKYKKLFDQWGLGLIPVSTNAYEFYQFRTPWYYSNTLALAGISMALGNRVATYSQPGDVDQGNRNRLRPSSNIHLFSTESTKFSSHAHVIDRSKKLSKMLDWSPVQKHLRVCLDANYDQTNHGCQKCEKCINTNLILYLFDKQNEFSYFDMDITIFKFIRLCWEVSNLSAYRPKGYLSYLKKKNRTDLILIYWMMIPVNKLKQFISSELISRIPKKFLYTIKRKVYKNRNISDDGSP